MNKYMNKQTKYRLTCGRINSWMFEQIQYNILRFITVPTKFQINISTTASTVTIERCTLCVRTNLNTFGHPDNVTYPINRYIKGKSKISLNVIIAPCRYSTRSVVHVERFWSPHTFTLYCTCQGGFSISQMCPVICQALSKWAYIEMLDFTTH